MKKYFLILPITITLIILFYPVISNSNGTGSPGGKTNSNIDGQNCTVCHQGIINSGVAEIYITTNIPVNGYVIGNTYNIILKGIKTNCIKFGFELTAESGANKSGYFMITDNTTKLVNASNAVTHKSSGTSGNTTKSWTMDWTPTSSSSEYTTFYASLMFANGNGNYNGDKVFTTSILVNEEIISSFSDRKQKTFTFNSITKIIETSKTILIYDIRGKLVLKTKEKSTDISYLKKGIYILKSEAGNQKIILN